MSPAELIGFNEFEGEIGANLWESRAPLPTNVKEPTPETPDPPRPGSSEAEARAFELQILTNADGSRRYTNDQIKAILIESGLTDEKGKPLR